MEKGAGGTGTGQLAGGQQAGSSACRLATRQRKQYRVLMHGGVLHSNVRLRRLRACPRAALTAQQLKPDTWERRFLSCVKESCRCIS